MDELVVDLTLISMYDNMKDFIMAKANLMFYGIVPGNEK